MAGELVQGILGEFRDPEDASDPLSTLGRFVGTGMDLAAMGEVVEIAGDIGGGLAFGAPDTTPAPDLQLNATGPQAATVQQIPGMNPFQS